MIHIYINRIIESALLTVFTQGDKGGSKHGYTVLVVF